MRTSSGKFRYRARCKYCRSEKSRLSKTGVDAATYSQLLEKQQGRCAICKSKPNGRWGVLHADHDHETGAVRGLLCFTCNVVLGLFEKNRGVFEEYLRVA
jgi:hypothetical protein